MGQRLIGLPVEIGLRAARLGFRAARLPLDLIGGLTGRGGGDDGGAGFAEPEAEAAASRPAPARTRTESVNGTSSAPGTTPGAADRAQAAAPPLAPTAVDGGPVDADEPEHVSEEPELVAEFAESGAEDGAHAELDVSEPWEGYSQMKVRDIEQRLQAATAEEIAVVQLYEQTHKARQSVLRAAERRMNRQAAERDRP